VLVDWEIHAVAYRGQDARMTVPGIIDRCVELGLTHIGILDHLAPERGWPPDVLRKVFAELAAFKVPGCIRVCRAAEVDIREQGFLPELPHLRKELGLDYVVGSVHEGRREGASDSEYLARQFELMMGVLREPCPIDVLGHPWGGHSLKEVPKEMLDAVVRAAAKVGVGIEVTPRFRAERPDFQRLVTCSLAEGARLAPVSDAHLYEQLGDTVALQALLKELGAQETDLWFPGDLG
jgi:histidinol phosphatase-like PHP family hydrolase